MSEGSLGWRRALLWVFLPLLLVGVAHYAAPHELRWVHDVARRAFYVPIVVAGALGGVPWGIAAALAAVVIYVPHAFILHIAFDPASQTEKLLELLFYPVLGVASGLVSERLRREGARLETLTVELRRSLAEVKARDALLARAARLESLGQLTAGLAHEIRNPLHAMRGTAEILLDAVPPEAPEHAIGQAHISEIDRLSRLLGRFLDFARSREPNLRAIDLREVLRQTAALLRAQASRQQTALVVEEGSPVRVRADHDELVQVVLGIAINGLQALEEGGGITLSIVEGADGERGARVQNDGPPIPEGLQLFDPFVTTREQGTGLGLSAAWRIVDDHGGRIEVENLPEGAGVAFTVWLVAG